MKNKLHGIVSPLVTPLLDDNTLNLVGLGKLIEHVIAGGLHEIFILGTTGEAQSLGFDLRTKMVVETAKILKGRLPLLVGISDTSVADSVRLAVIAKENGADEAVSAPPYYYATAQAEMIEFYNKLIDQLPLPIYSYNMPSHTKVSFTVISN